MPDIFSDVVDSRISSVSSSRSSFFSLAFSILSSSSSFSSLSFSACSCFSSRSSWIWSMASEVISPRAASTAASMILSAWSKASPTGSVFKRSIFELLKDWSMACISALAASACFWYSFIDSLYASRSSCDASSGRAFSFMLFIWLFSSLTSSESSLKRSRWSSIILSASFTPLKASETSFIAFLRASCVFSSRGLNADFPPNSLPPKLMKAFLFPNLFTSADPTESGPMLFVLVVLTIFICLHLHVHIDRLL